MANNIKRTISDLLTELSAVLAAVDAEPCEEMRKMLLAAPCVFTAAAGRSGLILRSAAMRLMHLGKSTYVVGEVVTPAIREGDLLLILSGSGETGSLVVMAKKAKTLGAKVALITANPSSTLADLADLALYLPAPTPKVAASSVSVRSRQPMGNLFEQGALLLLDAIIMELMENTGKTSEIMFQRHANLE